MCVCCRGIAADVNPCENTINTTNVRNLDILWAAPVGATHGSPSVAYGRVYIGTLGGQVYSLSTKTGAPFAGWPVTTGGIIQASTAVGNHAVYVGASTGEAGQLFSFNAITGAPLIQGGDIGDGPPGSPTLYGGNVYIPDSNTYICGFDAITGAEVTGFPIFLLDHYFSATVSAANGRIFEGDSDGNFYAFDATTGVLIPGFPNPVAGSTISSTAALGRNQVFFGSSDEKLYGVRRRDGSAISGFPVSATGGVISSPALGDGQVIVGSLDAKLYSFDPTSGALNWSTLLDHLIVGSPVIANGVVYVNTDLSLYALHEDTGAILWRGSVSSFSLSSSPVVVDGIVYMGSTDGNLYAFSVNGVFPPSRLPGGELGVMPAISSLKPDFWLRAQTH